MFQEMREMSNLQGAFGRPGDFGSLNHSEASLMAWYEDEFLMAWDEFLMAWYEDEFFMPWYGMSS